MVVITVIPLGKLKATAPFTEFQLLQKPHVRQQAQGSVHSGQRDPQLQGGQLLMHLLRAQVTAGAAVFEQLENSFALGCQTTPVLVQALLQGSIGGSRRGGQRHQPAPTVLNSSH